MPFDPVPDSGPARARQGRGRRSHLAGIAAEEAVCRRYVLAGYDLVASRKLCPEAEIDLLFQRNGELVAVEVKQSATHALAWEHAASAQLRRVAAATEGCMQDMADQGICNMRLDLALVNAMGEIDVMEGVFLD